MCRSHISIMTSSVQSVCFIVLWIITLTCNARAELLNYELHEEEEAGLYVGNILTDSTVADSYGSDVTRTLTFEFLSIGGMSDYFDLQRNTGILTTARKIDRETVCPQQEACVMHLDVALSPSAYFQVIQVRVTIVDINDFMPDFDLDDIERSLVESTPPGLLFPLQPARDLDSPMFGVKRYELRGGDGKFQIVVKDLGGGIIDIRLVLNNALDHEHVDSYELELFAYDGGNPPLIGRQLIRLDVTDANDNVPTFYQSTHELQVAEDYPTGYPLREVTARDLDSGENSKLTYSLEEKSQRLYGDTFQVFPDNGTLLLVSSLDYERQKLYSLKVLASDRGDVALTSTAIIIIHVVDVNDNKPVIRVNDQDSSGSVDVIIEENQPADTFIAILSVDDVDQGQNGYVDCTLNLMPKENSFRMFEIMKNEYQIVTNHPLDREVQRRHALQVTCDDSGTPLLYSHVNINVFVIDLNDNAPVFTHEPYNFFIAENNALNAFIGEVTAVDADSGDNARVAYSFCNSADSPAGLNLDERNGLLTAKEHFDHETRAMISICIQAQDQGPDPLFVNTYVTITVTDVDDNEPKFNQSEYSFDVYENMADGTVVGRIAAYDFDSAPYNAMLYSIDINPYFAIDVNTGIITTTKSLDREEKSSHTLTAYVRSLHYPAIRKTDITDIVIHVWDENDNYPIIHSPQPNAVLPPLSSQAPRGSNVTRVIATDKDTGANGRLNYSLTEFDSNAFRIDSRTGWITTQRELTFIAHARSFTLQVTVADLGLMPRDTSIVFTVVVNASIPFYEPVVGSQTTFFRPEVKLILVASAAALFLVFLIICVVCVLFIRNRKSSDSKDGYYVARQEEVNGRKDISNSLVSE